MKIYISGYVRASQGNAGIFVGRAKTLPGSIIKFKVKVPIISIFKSDAA